MGDTTQRRRIVRALRVMRVLFRWCRICLWLLILAVVASVAYLHLVGLPDFLKRAILTELHEQGMNAKFSEMRLSWNHEILVHDFAFGSVDDPLSPSLTVGSARVKLDYAALFRLHFKLDEFSIVRGQLRVPLADTNTPALSLDAVQVALKFLPGDCVSLDNATANFHGISIHFDGILTNFPAIKDWNLGVAPKTETTNRVDWQESLQDFANIANQVTFSSPPRLWAHVSGDARDPNTIRAELRLVAAGAQTPWGTLSRFSLSADCSRILDPGSDPFAKLHIATDSLSTHWGGGKKIDLQLTLRHNDLQTGLLDAAAEFSAEQPHGSWTDDSTNWLRAGSIKWSGAVTFQAGTNFMLYDALGELHARHFESGWASVDGADIILHTARTNSQSAANPKWGVWAAFAPYITDWTAETRGIKANGVEVQQLDCSGQWNAPEVTIEKLESTLFGGELNATAHLDINSRELKFNNTLNFDPTPAGPLLGPEVQDLLSQFTWGSGPQITNEGKVILPPWIDRSPGWVSNLLQQVELRGTVQAAKGSYREIAFDSGSVVYVFTNLTWYLPRLHAQRADGDFYMDLLSNNGTGEYDIILDTQLDPRALAIYLDFIPNRDQWLKRFTYSKPPKIHTHLQGNWNNSDVLNVTSDISATNFTFYNKSITDLSVFLVFTNSVLDIQNFSLFQREHSLSSPLVRIDFARDTLTVTNAFSTLDPVWLPRLFGTNLPAFFTDFGFESPPSIQINGAFCFTNPAATDLHFIISGNYFRWKKLEIENVFGNIDWTDQRVRLNGVQAKLYGEGVGSGWAQFNTNPTNGIDVRFQTAINNADLGEIVHGLLGKTNQIEGKVDGAFTVSGNSEDEKSWQGTGAVNVRDALLWNIPLFGVFSEIVNVIAPNAGNSRARKASGTFVINNGVLRSDDLQIQATTFRLLYRGTIDPHKINARIEAQILENAPLVGTIFNIVLKPLTKVFEFRITGPLDNPVTEPVFFPPGLFSVAMHPFHSLRSILPSSSEPTQAAQPTPAADPKK